MYEINDCSKCGSKAFLFCGDKDLYSVDCDNNPPCHNSTKRIYKDEGEAVRAWNKMNPAKVAAGA